MPLVLIWGAAGDALMNLMPWSWQHKGIPIASVTSLFMDSFPLNRGFFTLHVSGGFCAAVIAVFLLTSTKRALLPSHCFVEGTLLLLMLFGFCFGALLWAALIPSQLLMATGGSTSWLEIIVYVLNGSLWIAVFALMARGLIRRSKTNAGSATH
jgi:hypothetical protein